MKHTARGVGWKCRQWTTMARPRCVRKSARPCGDPIELFARYEWMRMAGCRCLSSCLLQQHTRSAPRRYANGTSARCQCGAYTVDQGS